MIYLVSGLAANEKVFRKLDLQNRPFTFLSWLTPLKNETLDDYITRFSERINTDEEIILIGTSFGGIVCQELAKRFTVKKIILISSILNEKEFSPLIRFLRKTRLYKLINFRLLMKMRPVLYHYFTNDPPEEKKGLLAILENVDINLIRWSVDAAINWKSAAEFNNIYRIHGTRDLMFPIKYISQAHLIKNGSHLMILRNADEVNKWINSVIEN